MIFGEIRVHSHSIKSGNSSRSWKEPLGWCRSSSIRAAFALSCWFLCFEHGSYLCEVFIWYWDYWKETSNQQISSRNFIDWTFIFWFEGAIFNPVIWRIRTKRNIVQPLSHWNQRGFWRCWIWWQQYPRWEIHNKLNTSTLFSKYYFDLTSTSIFHAVVHMKR